jgi:hypothetical protein
MGYGDGEQIIASRKECLPLSLGKEGKEAVVAPPGMVWVGFEWRDADLRVFAWLSKSESLREALAGGDFYGRLAQRMLVTDCLGPDFALSLLPRIVGLSLYNGLAHGLTGWAVSREFKGLTVHKAATLSESLWERDFPDFVKWMEASCREWGKGDAVVGYALGGSKRVRKVEGVTRERYVREALEVCGRGSVGILLKKVLAELAGLAIGDLVKATLPGYDSVYFLVPEGERDRFIREVGPLASVEIGDSLRMRPIWKSGTSWGNVEPLGADIVGEF